MATCAPSRARCSAVAAPMPREPPVTSATLPASFFDMTVSFGEVLYQVVQESLGPLTRVAPFSAGARGAMRTGRPRQCDVDEALDRARAVFRRRGHEGATLDERTGDRP